MSLRLKYYKAKIRLLNAIGLRREGYIYGYKLYDKPLLISYSRSGTNWVRYFIEFTSKQPTPGFRRLIKDPNKAYFFDRAHAGYKVAHKHPKILLLVRNYRECLVRHHGIDVVRKYRGISSFLKAKLMEQPPSWYISNIQAFDKFTGPKLLVYYEDLVAKPESTFKSIADFFGLSGVLYQDFINNLEHHKQQSILAYSENQQSKTAGSGQKLDHYTKAYLTPEEAKVFDEYFEINYPKLFKKYLEHYKI